VSVARSGAGVGARIQGIDLLRGVAVGLVLLRHALPEQFAGAGVVGVVMFFSLSGHLITGLLVDEFERSGTVRLRRFYANRALRLVPALLVLVAAFAAVTLVFDPLDDVELLPRSVAVALTWTANLPFAGGSDAIFHLWTLATEEQFYLLWPALLLFAARRGRTAWAVALAAVAGIGVCVASLVWLAPHPDLAYALPTSWVVCFVIGAASRYWRGTIHVGAWVTPVALVALVALSVLPVRGHVWTYLVVGPLVAVLAAALMLRWSSWPVVPAWLRPLVLLGTVSYAAYLWNYPLTLWLRAAFEPLDAPWLGGLVALPLTVAAAALSWLFVERPVAGWRARRSADTAVRRAGFRP